MNRGKKNYFKTLKRSEHFSDGCIKCQSLYKMKFNCQDPVAFRYLIFKLHALQETCELLLGTWQKALRAQQISPGKALIKAISKGHPFHTLSLCQTNPWVLLGDPEPLVGVLAVRQHLVLRAAAPLGVWCLGVSRQPQTNSTLDEGLHKNKTSL